jgi:CheY-like chemotaxis protein
MGLEHLGAKVCIAGTGAAALEQSLTFRPTLVLLDIDLPDINGHEVGRRLRQMPELGAIPLVGIDQLVAGVDQLEHPRNVALVRYADMMEHVAKPLDLDALAACSPESRSSPGRINNARSRRLYRWIHP